MYGEREWESKEKEKTKCIYRNSEIHTQRVKGM